MSPNGSFTWQTAFIKIKKFAEVNGMNFLIYSVEDDPNIALILNKTLSKQGYTVQSFPNGTSFGRHFQKNNRKWFFWI